MSLKPFMDRVQQVDVIGSWPSRQRTIGAVLGGIVAGLALSTWMLIGEVASRAPSQLIAMERQVWGWFGAGAPAASTLPSAQEEYIGNFGHLALSALAGLAYALVWRRDRSVIFNGFVFGMAFFAAAHAVVGPLIGLTPPPWKVPLPYIWLGVVINGFFGVCTAYFAHQFDTGARDAVSGPRSGTPVRSATARRRRN